MSNVSVEYLCCRDNVDIHGLPHSARRQWAISETADAAVKRASAGSLHKTVPSTPHGRDPAGAHHRRRAPADSASIYPYRCIHGTRRSAASGETLQPMT